MAGPKANMYTPETVELALSTAAALNGNRRRTKEALEQEGVKIPERTIRTWIEKTHRERYLEIREEGLPALKAKMAEQLERIVLQGSELQAEVLNRITSNLDDLEPKDMGKTFQQVSIGTGIASQRAGELRGDASVVLHTTDVDGTIAGLKRLGLVQDSTAEEVTDAEVVAETQAISASGQASSPQDSTQPRSPASSVP